MKNTFIFSTALLLGCAGAAMAQTASMDLVGVGNGNSAFGIYLSPYTATINGGVPTYVICDDFADDSFMNETWTANVSNVANLGASVKWGQSQTQLYDEMAYLAYQLLAPGVMSNINTQAAISFAIWDLSDPTGVSTYSSNSTYQAFLSDSLDTSGVKYWTNLAASNYGTLSQVQLANVSVYTPNTNYPILCAGNTCANTPPQEFLSISTPEPSSVSSLAVDLLALVALVFVFRRKIFGVI